MAYFDRQGKGGELLFFIRMHVCEFSLIIQCLVRMFFEGRSEWMRQ